MRPYFAVLYDSFHEALVSRVLWVVLALISFFLLCLAPLGYRTQTASTFLPNEFKTPREFARLLADPPSNAPSAVRRIAAAVPDDQRERLRSVVSEREGRRDFFRAGSILADALNATLPSPTLYDTDAFRDVRRPRELDDLLPVPASQLAPAKLARRNRLLIEGALGEQLRPRPDEVVQLTFAGFDVWEIPFPKRRVDRIVEQFVMAGLVQLLLGVLAVFVAILVTASIVPQMFQPGSLHLLLSKPVSRSLLLVAKFLGGCAFILVCVAYLVVGLWLIAGVRWGLWNRGLLLCIPLFLFLFAIYYVVSVLVGVWWKNAILSVVATCMFWFVCFAIGTSHEVLQQQLHTMRKLVTVRTFGRETFAVDEVGSLYRWNGDQHDWQTLQDARRGPPARVLGLLPLAKTERLVWCVQRRAPFGNLLLSQSPLQVAGPDDGWQGHDLSPLPPNAFELLRENDDGVLAIAETGVFRLNGSLDPPKPVEVFGFKLPLGQPRAFRPVGPSDLTLDAPAAAAYDEARGQLIVCSRGRWSVLERDGARYVVRRSVDLLADEDGESGPGPADASPPPDAPAREEGVAVAASHGLTLVARSNGELRLVDEERGETVARFRPEPHSQPRFVSAARERPEFAAVFQSGNVWLVDGAARTIARPRLRGQGDLSAAQFTATESGADRLTVVEDAVRAATYERRDRPPETRLAPKPTRTELIFDYAIAPLYFLLPKPGKLDETVQYFLTGSKTTDLGLQTGDLRAGQARLNPWLPVWSSGAFIAVLLLIACVYIERQEF